MVVRRPVVFVGGSGKAAQEDAATPIGTWIAEQGCHLLTGGRTGVMRSVSRAFTAVERRRGLSIGIIPEGQQANEFLDIRILTHLPGLAGPKGSDTRNHINVRTADLVILLPGGDGTKAEYELTIDAGKRAFVWLPAGERLGLAPGYTHETLHTYKNARELTQVFSEVAALLQAAADELATVRPQIRHLR